MTPQRVSLITLGVRDLDRSRTFYAALGWEPVPGPPEVVFYQLDGQIIGLFGLEPLAKEQGRSGASLGFGAMSLAQNYSDQDGVDIAFAKAIQAGAIELKSPEKVFWGVYSGYFSDPDGHVWEVAHNPFWTIDETGRVTIPTEGSTV